MKALMFWAVLCAEVWVGCHSAATNGNSSLAELGQRYQCLLDWLVADCPEGHNAESLLRDRPDLQQAGRYLRRMAQLEGTGGAEYRQLREATIALLDRAYADETGWNRKAGETQKSAYHVSKTNASGGR
jgi:hypothetical protein